MKTIPIHSINGKFPKADAVINQFVSYVRIAHFRARGKLAREVIEQIEDIWLQEETRTKSEAITEWRNTWGQNYF
jgi:hypothetical protein